MNAGKGFINHPANESNWLSWIFLLVNFALTYFIAVEESYNFIFLAGLIVNIGLLVFFFRRINNLVLNISRILLGALFIYSGIVKGVDPLGTMFKIEDYFYAYNTIWAIPFALILSVILNAAEFTLGALLLLRVNMKWVSILSLLMMLMFTLTTLYDALYSPVPDCGCFGDALVISNWQTFYKNLVINSFLLLVFLRRFDFKPYKSKIVEYSTIVLVIFGFITFENYNLNNLPIIDFRPWKVGNRLLPENPKPVKYFLTYKNVQTGEEKEFLSVDLPWQDSIFMADWKWAHSREEDPNITQMNVFPMIDAEGNDVSKEIVSDENYTFIFVIYQVDDVDVNLVPMMNEFFVKATTAGYNTLILSSALPEEFYKFQEDNKLVDFPIYNSDDTSLKAAIRSNPGLIVVKSGVVIAKYHYNNIPDFTIFIKELTLD